MTGQERWNFIGESEHIRMASYFNSEESAAILFDKWKTYETLKPFFKRKACLFRGIQDKDSFMCLLNECGKVIIKPLSGSFGEGIQIIKAKSMDKSCFERFASFYSKGFIAEEVIEQVEEMSQLHPESVNTLRIHTLNIDGQIEVFHPYIRIGRGRNIVDNAGAGGVFTSCDEKTGRVLNIVDESGHTYEKHPDNNFPLKEFTVPCWDEAFNFAKELATQIPGLGYAGWDLALTKEGWVLIEGNPRAQLIFQISEGRGCYTDIEAMLMRHGKKVEWKRFKH